MSQNAADIILNESLHRLQGRRFQGTLDSALINPGPKDETIEEWPIQGTPGKPEWDSQGGLSRDTREARTMSSIKGRGDTPSVLGEQDEFAGLAAVGYWGRWDG